MPRPSAKQRLLDCAERLFAEHGIEGASLRAINAEAGLSAAALHYHFGSKQALVEALLERRMSEPMQRRAELLDALEARDEPATPRELLEVLVRPLAELLAREGEGGLRYVRLLSRLQADGRMDTAFVAVRFADGVARLGPLLEAALPDQPVPLLHLRLRLAVELMLGSLASWESLASDSPEGALSLDAFVDALLDFLTGAMEAPIHHPPGAGREPAPLAAAS